MTVNDDSKIASVNTTLELKQGTLTEGEVDLLVLTSSYKMSYPNEEVNFTEPSPSVSTPWLNCTQSS